MPRNFLPEVETLIIRILFFGLAAFQLSSIYVEAQCDEWGGKAEAISGFVFNDLNKSGKQDAGEPGLANVSVSNGCDVVLTDIQGFYTTVLSPGQILFISQPSKYVVPVDENHLPQFYYMHYPEGSPGAVDNTDVKWNYPVIEPTGPLPAQINFPLYELSDLELRFSAYGFADTQAKTEIDQDMLREDLVNTLFGNPHGAAFTLTVGDVVFDNLDLYDRHKAMMALIGIPNWNLPGNHDINFESPNAHLANETYKKHYGPIYYSFNYGNAHVVALNNVEYAGAASQGLRGSGKYRGYLSEDQLRWLKQDLAHVPEDRLVVVATHIPLVAEATDGHTIARGPNTENLDKLLELLRPFKNIYGLAGHDTSNSWKVEVGHSHGWHGRPWIAHTLAEARGAGWQNGPRDLRGVSDAMMEDGNPNGFYLLKFDDNTLRPKFIPFPFGGDAIQSLRIVLDPELENSEGKSINRGRLKAGTKVIVNLFDGGQRDRVNLSLNGDAPESMTYVIRTDPFVEKVFALHPDSYSRSYEPELSTHIWEYELPAILKTGIHHIVVESEDEFGQQHRGVFTFEITD